MKSEYLYMGLTWLYEFLNLAFVANRLYVRCIAGRPNFSDALVVIAFLLVTAAACIDTVLVATGAGSTFDGDAEMFPLPADEDTRRLEFWQKLNWAQDILYYIPLYCIKGAILSFLLEVTPPVLHNIRRAIWIGVVFSVLGLGYSPFPWVFYCNPLKARWDFSYDYPEDACSRGDNPATVATVWHMFTDVYIYAIPFFLIRHLPKMISFSQRLATYLMFGAGFLLLGTSIPQLNYGIDPSINVEQWNSWWGLHESHLAITVACLPTLRVTAQRIIQRVGGWEGVQEENGRRRSKKKSLAMIKRGVLDTREVVGHPSSTEGDLESAYKTTRAESKQDVGVQKDMEPWDSSL